VSKLRKAAKGQMCMVRIPGVCNFNPETTVLAHLGGAGMGAKSHDMHGAWACSECHALVDGRINLAMFPADDLKLMHLQGVIRTQEELLKMGLIETA
jgi:hypothetical protein